MELSRRVYLSASSSSKGLIGWLIFCCLTGTHLSLEGTNQLLQKSTEKPKSIVLLTIVTKCSCFITQPFHRLRTLRALYTIEEAYATGEFTTSHRS